MRKMKKSLMMTMSFCLLHSAIACSEEQDVYKDSNSDNLENQESVPPNGKSSLT